MKLLQLNTWHLKLMKKVVDIIDEEKPDILTLQEVPDSAGNPGLIDTLTELNKTILYPHIYYSPVHNFEVMHATVAWGNVILTNQPIGDTSTIFTNGEHTDDFSFETHSYNIRNFQHVTLDIGDKKLHILNHHGYHISEHKNGNDETLKACQHIAAYISKLDGPVILAGDFNLAPDSESIKVFDGMLRNLSKEYHLKTTRTDLTNKQEVCDYIFVSEDITVNDFYASDIMASDHKALLLDFEILEGKVS